MSGKAKAGTVARTGVKAVKPEVPEPSLRAARELVDSAGRREDAPVRRSFVRTDDKAATPPLARLVARGGRGGGVSIKLFLALIWRCSAPPFDTEISARQWAVLLGLEDPSVLGARRVTSALDVLEREKLVALTRRRGDSSIIRLLEESGSGADYELPSTAYNKSPQGSESPHIYFKIPRPLLSEGHIQAMSASALAMLLILLAEQRPGDEPTWWSTELFPRRYALTPTTRSKGTSELIARGLLLVNKRLVSPDPARVFTRQRVRNTYVLINDARPAPKTAPAAAGSAGPGGSREKAAGSRGRG